jgi:phospholipid/cholesterol/gamma-HCH transport system substrate-binding protein
VARGRTGSTAGPGPHGNAAVPAARASNKPSEPHRYWRALAGVATVVSIAAVVAVVTVQFRGGFNSGVPVTVMSPRAGLVMNPDAKVKLRGVQVGKVTSLEVLPGGRTVLHLAMDPAQLQFIPANVLVNIASTTVFGAKFVQLVTPARPAPETMYAGQVLDAGRVTVEINTVFQKLVAMLSMIDPPKLNETLGAIAAAVNGRGHEIGQMLSDLDAFLATLDPALANLSHDLAVAPAVLGAYADAAPDLLLAASNATRISQTVVDEQHNLDALLISITGLAEIGQDVLATNRQSLSDVVHLLVPTTDLTNKYNRALFCMMGGLVLAAYQPNPVLPGAMVDASFTLGHERFRYPQDLPKVAATGGPQCVAGLPNIPYEARPPYVVADVGYNPARYGNEGILLNSDALKAWLYGPIPGPPRNTAQIGQPG